LIERPTFAPRSPQYNPRNRESRDARFRFMLLSPSPAVCLIWLPAAEWAAQDIPGGLTVCAERSTDGGVWVAAVTNCVGSEARAVCKRMQAISAGFRRAMLLDAQQPPPRRRAYPHTYAACAATLDELNRCYAALEACGK
jgi:hypothetical protein